VCSGVCVCGTEVRGGCGGEVRKVVKEDKILSSGAEPGPCG